LRDLRVVGAGYVSAGTRNHRSQFNLQFNESNPLRDEPSVTPPIVRWIPKDVRSLQWVQLRQTSELCAVHSQATAAGNGPKPVIVQFARDDQTVPNPTSNALIRAGDLVDRTTLFRNDLVVAGIPGAPKNAHTFLTNIDVTRLPLAVVQLAFSAQTQIATFFSSNGVTVIDPDGPGPFFEVPVVGPLPEALNFIP
jgi:hypothetical protein